MEKGGYYFPHEAHDPPAHPEHEPPPLVPATAFPSLLWAENSESLRLSRVRPQLSQAAGESASLIGRSRLNSRRHVSQTYS